MKCNIGFNYDPKLYRIKPETTKWWIMPENTPFHNNEDYNKFGSCYHVEEQKDIYSRSCPPLKSGFNSKEEAEKWLNNYLLEQEHFQSAAKRFEIFSAVMSDYADRLKNHKQLEYDYLKFKVNEFLKDIEEMNEVIWSANEGE